LYLPDEEKFATELINVFDLNFIAICHIPESKVDDDF
jgi:hypothetical protein